MSTSPGHVSLWFSTVVDPEFSTAIVENGAHEYINTRDASLSPGDAREMDVPLLPHLPPGVYTVVWRAASDSDGRILEGAYRFAIVQPVEIVPKQSSHAAWPFAGQFDRLVGTFALMLMLGVACLLLLSLPRAVTGDNTVQSVTGQPVYRHLERGTAHPKLKLSLRFTHALRWQSMASVVILIYLGLLLGTPGIISRTRTSPGVVPALQSDTLSALTAFHAAVRTSDTRYSIVLDIHINRCCASTFAMSASDASDGKPLANVSVVLFTTMLDMPMGTDTLKMQPDGKGHFSAQSDLSMGGLWQICILMRTVDHTFHKACVKVLIPYV